ncbi:MAG: amidohydrolase family protein [Vicinamibacteria bacterium]
MIHRREFLKAALCGCGLARSRPSLGQSGKGPLTVDFHAHAYVHDDWPLIRNRPEAKPLETFVQIPEYEEFTSVEARIAEMDREGVDVQAVSLYVGQYHYWAERELSRDVVAIQNQKLAEACARYPNRLVGLGAVSLHIPDLAAEQMAEAVKLHRFPGFMVTGSVSGEEISAPRFDPFWAKAKELDVVIFIHPRSFAEGASRLAGGGNLGNTIGNPLETTVALSHMIFDGFLDRFPGLTIVAAHGGGYLPSYLGRSDNCHAVDARCRQMARTPSEYLKEIYYDTLVYSSRVLRHLIDEVGVERIVMGTDYPFPVASRDPLGDVSKIAGLSESEKEAILGATAARLLKLPSLSNSGPLARESQTRPRDESACTERASPASPSGNGAR